MRITQQLLDEVDQIAEIHFRGHYTIFRFSTHWKAMWGTPTEDIRMEAAHLAPYNTFEECLIGLIYQHDRILAKHFSDKVFFSGLVDE
jgi:hypothetical protein